MKRRIVALFLFCVLLLLSACASTKAASSWRPGDTVVCPYCGREFPLPQKMGK